MPFLSIFSLKANVVPGPFQHLLFVATIHFIPYIALVAIVFLAAAVVGLVLATRYEMDDQGIVRHRAGGKVRVEWETVSPFSETEPTHREGDRHCMLKTRNGETLMAVGPHLVGRSGKEMMEEIRRRIGPPSLPPNGEPEVFRFGDFGMVPPYEIHLDAEALRAVHGGSSVEARLDEIEEIAVEAWPEVGPGLERLRIVRKGEVLYLDSRLVGFWPLAEHLAAHCPNAKVSDNSRRRQMGREALA